MKKQSKWLLLMLAVLILLTAAVACGGEKAKENKNPKQGENNKETVETAAPDGMLEYSDGKTTLHFAKDEDGQWQWQDDPAFPLDESELHAVLTSVEEMMSAQPIKNAKKPSYYGLDSKETYLRTTDQKGNKVTFYFGDKNKNDQYYMRRTDHKGKVYAAPKALTKALSRSIYDMMKLPKLPELTEKNMQTIVINGGDGVKFSVKASDGQWVRQGTKVSKKMQPVVKMLDGLALDRCIDYRPSHGVDKICGLRHPAAVIRVDYVNSMNVETSFRMEVGDKRGSGRYVRINDDNTIYLIDSKTLTPLLRLAQEGL